MASIRSFLEKIVELNIQRDAEKNALLKPIAETFIN